MNSLLQLLGLAQESLPSATSNPEYDVGASNLILVRVEEMGTPDGSPKETMFTLPATTTLESAYELASLSRGHFLSFLCWQCEH
jgi:hypothetical protein